MSKMAIIVRTDLGMGKGKIAGQVAHASVKCAIYAYDLRTLIGDKRFEDWMKDDCQKKVVLKVSSQEELENIEAHAKADKLIMFKVRDFGLTQIEPNTVTCLAIGPDDDELIDKITKELKLL